MHALTVGRSETRRQLRIASLTPAHDPSPAAQASSCATVTLRGQPGAPGRGRVMALGSGPPGQPRIGARGLRGPRCTLEAHNFKVWLRQRHQPQTSARCHTWAASGSVSDAESAGAPPGNLLEKLVLPGARAIDEFSQARGGTGCDLSSSGSASVRDGCSVERYLLILEQRYYIRVLISDHSNSTNHVSP